MADSLIAQYLNKILEAVYGKDVRQAIYDSISQCYSDVNSPQLTTKAIAAVVQEKIDDGTIPAMTVPLATPNALGGIKADARTSDDILNVRLGEDGHLYAEHPAKVIRFKNMIGSWGYFPNSNMVKGVDYNSINSANAVIETDRLYIDSEGINIDANQVYFTTLDNKSNDLTPVSGHKYWIVVKGKLSGYGDGYISYQHLRNANYNQYDSFVQVSMPYNTDGKYHIAANMSDNWDDALVSSEDRENKFRLTWGNYSGCYFKVCQWIMIFDITETFGSGNEPTNDELVTLFNKIYGTDEWEYISSNLTLDLGGDGTKKIENIIIPDDTGESGETGSGDSYLKGKSLYVIGDSLTQYSDWGNALCAAEGMTWYNWGFAGTTMAAPETPNYESGHTGVERVRRLPHDDDYVMENMIILIWLGINDTNLGSGVDETDIHTLYGGLNDVLSYLTTTFPKTPFGIMGLHRNSNKTVTTTNEIMKQICAKYSVPFFDTEAEGRIIPAYLSDGLHLGANATANIRRRIRQWIKTL